ncbi:MAG: DNA recombination/repair protein RecA [Chloroflexi bacterium]|nr:DNA recombination/repair protein RecA [Chloroflexota bacterium]MCI0649924.1 DNA recombination/repair protein RecA [Chloroflexota bacterium]MCI0729837.1 DNA recombination/repair protein RecA [Chloroflexota bacterium]
MADDKKRRLEQTIDGLRQQYGIHVVRPLKEQTLDPVRTVSTSFPQLDKALAGGIPAGRVSEIVSIPTSGGTTLALKIIANAQQVQGMAIYLDLERTFNPDYAARCGIDMRQLLLIRPYSHRQAVEITQDFVLSGDIPILVVDAPYELFTRPQTSQGLAKMLQRVNVPLRRAGSILLCLVSLPAETAPSLATTRPVHDTLAHYAAVRLVIRREHWTHSRKGFRGYQANVHIAKPVQKQVSIAITFNGTVAGER